MGKESKDPEVLLKKFEAKERSVRIRSIIFFTIPVVLAVIWLWYAGTQIFYAKEDLKEADLQVEALVEDLDDAGLKINEVNLEIKGLKTDLDDAGLKINEVNLEIKGLKTDLDDANLKINEANLEIKGLNQNLTDAREASRYLTQGINSYHAGRFSEAIGSFDKAIRVDPNNPLIFHLKGRSLFMNGEYKEAVRVLEETIEIDRNYVWAYYDLASAYREYGQTLEAERTEVKLSQMDPEQKEKPLL